MLRKVLCTLLALFVLAGGVLGADGTIVSYDKATKKLVLKIGEKDQTITLSRQIHVHDANDKDLAVKDYDKHLKKDVKVEIITEGDKIVELKLKK